MTKIRILGVLLLMLACKLDGMNARETVQAFTADNNTECAWYLGKSNTIAYKAIKLTFHNPKDSELYIAAYDGNKKKAEELMHSGANLESRGWHDMTPAAYAALNHDLRTLTILLELGANPNAQSKDGDSAISLAAGDDNESTLLKQVLKHGGNVNLEKQKTKETPLFEAVSSWSLENTKLLVEAGANVNARNWFNQTPLINAAVLTRFKIVYYLLENGADPTAKDSNGRSILHPLQKGHVASDDTEKLAYREKVIDWLKKRNLWHIEEP